MKYYLIPKNNNDDEIIADTGKNTKSNNIAGLISNVIDKNTSGEKKNKDSSAQKPIPFEAIKMDPDLYEKYLSNQNWRKRRLTQAKKYAKTHNMNVKLVTKMLNNEQLLYDESTKSITMNTNMIESSDGVNNKANGDNTTEGYRAIIMS